MSGTFGETGDLDWGVPAEDVDKPHIPDEPATPPTAPTAAPTAETATSRTPLRTPLAKRPATPPAAPTAEPTTAYVPPAAPPTTKPATEPVPTYVPPAVEPAPAPEPIPEPIKHVTPEPTQVEPVPVDPPTQTEHTPADPIGLTPTTLPPLPEPPPRPADHEPTRADTDNTDYSADPEPTRHDTDNTDYSADHEPTRANPDHTNEQPTPPRRGLLGRNTPTTNDNPKTATKNMKTNLIHASRGGRGKIIAFRTLAWTVLAILLLGGIKNVITPNNTPTTKELAATLQTQTGTKGFPLTPATAFATQFTNTYLTYNPETTDIRTETLKLFTPDAEQNNYVNIEKKQTILAGPFISNSEIIDKHNAIITLAAYTSLNEWMYLAVPIYAENNTTFVISGTPAFAATPTLATSPPDNNTPTIDSPFGETLRTDVLEGFFTAWGQSNTTALQRYTTKNPTPNTTNGLNDAANFISIDNVEFPETNKKTRTGTVTVQWMTVNGTYPQQYRVTVKKDPDGRWSISDIRAGVINPKGTNTN